MLKRALVAGFMIAAAAASAQQPPQPGIAPVTLGSEPYLFDTAEQHRIKVSVLAKGFPRPFAIEFLPGGDLLIVERGAARSTSPAASSGWCSAPTWASCGARRC